MGELLPGVGVGVVAPVIVTVDVDAAQGAFEIVH